MSRCISIPYGAIKRNLKVNGKWLDNKFQFLMVRLKDNLYCIVLIFSRIFQFHMVRLKATCPACDQDSHMDFNSLWCD